MTAIGIDIGGTNVRVLAIDPSGHVLERAYADTAPERGPQETIAEIIGMVRSLQARMRVAPTALGIGVTGPVDPFTGVVTNPFTLGGWPDTNLRSPFEAAFALPIAIDNDANVAAVGEAWLGAGRGYRRVAMVTIGTGIGVAVLLDGDVHRAADGRHGEAGHMVLRDGGPPCYCGASGCWEVLASGPAIARAGGEQAWREGGGLWTLAGGDRERVDAGLVFAAAAGGDPLAQSVVEDAAHCIGVGLANLAATVTPDVFILAGGVARQLEAMRPRIEAVLHRQAALIPTDVPVREALLGEDAGAIGAARLALRLQ
ncbi:MAG TPA: ROK family protein [Devosiaceae bacterium]|jgi:glucokinase|nr:ROK family protein [Devosiaceae bacterium]